MIKLDWDAISYVKRSQNRLKALIILQTPMMPSELGREMKISLTHASKIVRELNDKKLVTCLTEMAKVGRIYKISSKGIKVKESISFYGSKRTE